MYNDEEIYSDDDCMVTKNKSGIYLLHLYNYSLDADEVIQKLKEDGIVPVDAPFVNYHTEWYDMDKGNTPEAYARKATMNDDMIYDKFIDRETEDWLDSLRSSYAKPEVKISEEKHHKTR